MYAVSYQEMFQTRTTNGEYSGNICPLLKVRIASFAVSTLMYYQRVDSVRLGLTGEGMGCTIFVVTQSVQTRKWEEICNSLPPIVPNFGL